MTGVNVMLLAAGRSTRLGALGLAALFAGKVKPRGPVAVVVSGGNLDFSLLGTLAPPAEAGG